MLTNLSAQELPPLSNYTAKDYLGGNQNWKVDQSSEGLIYIGNNMGLLEYNGANWKLYPSVNNSIIRSVKVVEDKIFTGCYMNFGFWERNNLGNLEYTSLVKELKTPLLEDETFWNIINFEDYILFQSLNRIYIYSSSEKTFKIVDAQSDRAVMFKIGNQIYFQKSDEGIYIIENGESVLISNDITGVENAIVGGFLINRKPLFISEKGRFYFLEKSKLIKWNIGADKVLRNKKIYSSHQLSDGSFILGSISNGIYHIGVKGAFIKQVNKENGLLNNTVLCVFEDRDNNVWLGLDNGISTFNSDTPFSVYNDIKGNIGSVYTSKFFNDKLYIGTNQGLFYKTVNSYKDFQLVENTIGQVWCLDEIDNTLFCGHNKGTFVVENNVAVNISDFPGTWVIKKMSGNRNLLIQGNYNGISILKKTNNKWSFRNKIEGLDVSSRFFEFINEKELLVNHEYKGIYKLTLNNDYTKIINEKKYESLGDQSGLILYNNRILHTSNKGVYEYGKKTFKFSKDSVLTSLLYSKDPIQGQVIVDGKNNIWGFSDRNIVSVNYDAFSNRPKRIDIPIQKSYRSSELIMGFENLSHITDEIYLIGNTSGYSILNLEKLKIHEYSISINSIYKQQLNKPQEQLIITEKPILKPKENNLFISFSVPEFDKNIDVNYKFMLKGIYNDWSSWSDVSYVNLNNLPFGDYTFEVKAKVGNVVSNNIALFEFEIERRWYISNWMIAVYSVVFLLILFIIHLLNKRHYKKQKSQLLKRQERENKLAHMENEQEIMRLRNEKLRNEVESKTRELSSSTMNMIKKNELLNTIKKELLSLKNNSGLTPVIKIINKNLSTNSDWELFQEAFNNADTDFLKKIKELHPILTPNDLRLCAYLRLNLSSKEIAPLLNISGRSVEIKRYRLRKKMELLHEKSLVEYILEV